MWIVWFLISCGGWLIKSRKRMKKIFPEEEFVVDSSSWVSKNFCRNKRGVKQELYHYWLKDETTASIIYWGASRREDWPKMRRKMNNIWNQKRRPRNILIETSLFRNSKRKSKTLRHSVWRTMKNSAMIAKLYKSVVVDEES